MAKGGSQAAIAEQRKSRKQSNALAARSQRDARIQFNKTFKAQQAQAAEMSRLSRVTPTGSESGRDMASAADEIARAANRRTSFAKFRYGQ
jgi:hypothetical protein